MIGGKEAWRVIQEEEGVRRLRTPRPGVERGFEIVSSVPSVINPDFPFEVRAANKQEVKGLRSS